MQVNLKIPWIDKSMCKRDPECKAARYCEYDAFIVSPDCKAMGEGGFPFIDLEACKLCGDCEKACPEGAVKMI